jgi:hypothetical protein
MPQSRGGRHERQTGTTGRKGGMGKTGEPIVAIRVVLREAKLTRCG